MRLQLIRDKERNDLRFRMMYFTHDIQALEESIKDHYGRNFSTHEKMIVTPKIYFSRVILDSNFNLSISTRNIRVLLLRKN